MPDDFGYLDAVILARIEEDNSPTNKDTNSWEQLKQITPIIPVM